MKTQYTVMRKAEFESWSSIGCYDTLKSAKLAIGRDTKSTYYKNRYWPIIEVMTNDDGTAASTQIIYERMKEKDQ